jgi:hypothetical protein
MVHLSGPELLSKRYMPWRLLRASGQWASVYAARARIMKGYKSALVFPEQLMASSGTTLYCVALGFGVSNGKTDKHRVRVAVDKLIGVSLQIDGIKGKPTIDEIYDFEEESSMKPDVQGLKLLIPSRDPSSDSNSTSFMNNYLFTERNDALKFAKKRLSEVL